MGTPRDTCAHIASPGFCLHLTIYTGSPAPALVASVYLKVNLKSGDKPVALCSLTYYCS